jgi:dipeptidyl aminopeptidase/acylaminoacyl peptidase
MHVGQPRWSPNGKEIVFMGQDPGKPWSIFVMSADRGALQQLTDGRDGTGYDPTWSPDGRSVALGGNGGFPGSEHVIHILDVTTRQLSVLPASSGLFSPRWSPDGRYIAALSTDSARLVLFDLRSHRWTELAKAKFGYPTWSRNSESIYFDTYGADSAFYRVRVRDQKVERMFGLDKIPRVVGSFGPWTGLAPDGSPLIQRDASFDEIYALDWEAP